MSGTDMQALLGQLTSADALSAISKSTGVSRPKVKSTLTAALPLLLAGMKDNVGSAQGEAALEKALGEHAAEDTADAGAFLRGVDAQDGAKIVKHILGERESNVEKELAKRTGTTKAQTKSVLSNVAPLLLTLLGQQNQSSSDSIASLLIKLLLGNNSGGLLGSLLGGSGGGSLLGSLFGDEDQSENDGSLLESLFGDNSQEEESDDANEDGGLLESLFGEDTGNNNNSNLGGELLGSLLGGGNSNSSLGGQLLGALLDTKKSDDKKKTGGKKKAVKKKKS